MNRRLWGFEVKYIRLHIIDYWLSCLYHAISPLGRCFVRKTFLRIYIFAPDIYGWNSNYSHFDTTTTTHIRTPSCWGLETDIIRESHRSFTGNQEKANIYKACYAFLCDMTCYLRFGTLCIPVAIVSSLIVLKLSRVFSDAMVTSSLASRMPGNRVIGAVVAEDVPTELCLLV